MFVADYFSTEVCQNPESKVCTMQVRYDDKVIGTVEYSMSSGEYKNICVHSFVIGTAPEVEREDIFKHLFFSFAEQQEVPVYFKATELLMQEKRWLLDMDSEEMADDKQMTVWGRKTQLFMLKKVVA